jgi:hypothetical protein
LSNYTIKLQKKKDVAFYNVEWSPFIKLDKRRIRSIIPAEAGIFQIYFKTNGSLTLFSTHQAFYGGLRGIFLEIIDEDCQISFPGKEKIRESETYLRYSVSSSKDVLRDINHHFNGGESSGRFSEILVEESDCMKIAR